MNNIDNINITNDKKNENKIVEEKPRAVKKLLSSATIELRAAGINFFSASQILEDAFFHCQNSIEKSFMAFLIFKDVKFDKIDDFKKLAGYVIKADNDFIDICERVIELRTHPRHSAFTTDIQEVKNIIIIAEKLFQTVIEKMPLEYFKK